MRSYATSTDANGLRFGVVVSRFNHLVSARLLEGCTAELVKRGARPDDVHVSWVPGAFEIPLAARALAQTGRYDAVVTLGAVDGHAADCTGGPEALEPDPSGFRTNRYRDGRSGQPVRRRRAD